MSIVIDTPVVRCGKPKRRGVCQIPLRGGKCFTHDSPDLAARNSKVAQAFRDNNPDAFRKQRVNAGKRGFEKVGGMAWWAEQTDKARAWRLAHPSAYEKTLIEILMQLLALDVSYDREVILDADPRAVDFVLYRDRRAVAAIECTESANHATFGRDEKLAAKVEWLQCGLGLAAHVFYGGDDLQLELERIGAFLASINCLA